MKLHHCLPLGLCFCLTGCLPPDDRPPPGRLELQVSPSQETLKGTITADSWTLHFDRVLFTLGNFSLGGECVSYGQARYNRLLNIQASNGQKVGLVYGIGQCDVRFQTSAPDEDTLLGDSVSEAEKTLMRTPGSDAYVQNDGINLQVDGYATRNEVKKSFNWAFRRRLRFKDCTAKIGEQTVPGVSLSENSDEVISLRIAVERLFLNDTRDDFAKLQFSPFAQSDANNDGNVTLDELGKIQLSELTYAGEYQLGDADPAVVKTLADYVYLVLMQTIPRFRDVGKCAAELGKSDHH